MPTGRTQFGRPFAERWLVRRPEQPSSRPAKTKILSQSSIGFCDKTRNPRA